MSILTALDKYMPWQAENGSKQNSHVPDWIKNNKDFVRHCLRGLIQTDGSIYSDRGYKMVNFTNTIYLLAEDVYTMIENLGYKPHIYAALQKTGNKKYTVRLSRDVDDFLNEISIKKERTN